jgi:hypothetical protein
MAEYTYIDAIKGTLPTKDDTFYIHGLKYRLSGSTLFFCNIKGSVNSEIFNLVGHKNANDLFKEVLGEGNFEEASDKTFSPYALTFENARKILIKLWGTPKFKVGTIVSIKSDLHEGNDYGVYCNEDMLTFAGKEAEIISTRIKSDGRFGYNILYTIKICGNRVNSGWSWTEDMFCEAPVESVRESEEEEYNPEFIPFEEPKLKQDCVNTHTSIQLPNHSKHLTITL